MSALSPTDHALAALLLDGAITDTFFCAGCGDEGALIAAHSAPATAVLAGEATATARYCGVCVGAESEPRLVCRRCYYIGPRDVFITNPVARDDGSRQQTKPLCGDCAETLGLADAEE